MNTCCPDFKWSGVSIFVEMHLLVEKNNSPQTDQSMIGGNQNSIHTQVFIGVSMTVSQRRNEGDSIEYGWQIEHGV